MSSFSREVTCAPGRRLSAHYVLRAEGVSLYTGRPAEEVTAVPQNAISTRTTIAGASSAGLCIVEHTTATGAVARAVTVAAADSIAPISHVTTGAALDRAGCIPGVIVTFYDGAVPDAVGDSADRRTPACDVNVASAIVAASTGGGHAVGNGNATAALVVGRGNAVVDVARSAAAFRR